MNEQSKPHNATKIIQQYTNNFQPILGIVLGSGLSSFTNLLHDAYKIPYTELTGFPKITVQGHGNHVVLGYLNDVPIICLEGRAHTYEGINYDIIKTYVRTLRLLGCKYFIATNASGSLREDIAPGELMLINDHINMQPSNPLVGPNDNEFGPRFYPLDNAYDLAMRKKLLTIAAKNDIKLHEGVYISVLGPNYETAAEIRAFKLWGADAVGMSTVPEVLVANHCGMKVAVIATITNYATGLTTKSHSHDNVVAIANNATTKLSKILSEFIKTCK